MNILRFVVPTALGLMCLSSTLREAHADSIGINFTAFNPANELAPTTSAGVVAQNNWNNISDFSGTTSALMDSNGAMTTTTLAYDAENAGNSLAAVPDGDEQLNNGSLRSTQGRATTFTLSNISYANYDIYVYNQGNTALQQQTTLGGISFYSSSPASTTAGYVDNNAATPFTYTQATSTNSTAPTANANYVRFSGLSGASQTFSMIGLTSTGRVGGIQVVATPEPCTYAMMALGLVALCVLGAKRKKDGQAI